MNLKRQAAIFVSVRVKSAFIKIINLLRLTMIFSRNKIYLGTNYSKICPLTFPRPILRQLVNPSNHLASLCYALLVTTGRRFRSNRPGQFYWNLFYFSQLASQTVSKKGAFFEISDTSITQEGKFLLTSVTYSYFCIMAIQCCRFEENRKGL